MASPQTENGYTRIAHELHEALTYLRLSDYARAVVNVVIRLTYGYQRKEAPIPLREIVRRTGIRRKNICKVLRQLEERNIIYQKVVNSEGRRNATVRGIQKDWAKWQGFRLPLGTILALWEPDNLGKEKPRAKEVEEILGRGIPTETPKDAPRGLPGETYRGLPIATLRGLPGETPIKIKDSNKDRVKSFPPSSEKKTKAKKKANTPLDLLMGLYRAVIREDEGAKHGKELSAPGKEHKGAKKILELGATPEEAIQCYRDFKREPFWQGKHLSLVYIAQHIQAWKEAKVRDATGKQVRGDPRIPQEQWDYYAAHLDPKN